MPDTPTREPSPDEGAAAVPQAERSIAPDVSRRRRELQTRVAAAEADLAAVQDERRRFVCLPGAADTTGQAAAAAVNLVECRSILARFDEREAAARRAICDIWREFRSLKKDARAANGGVMPDGWVERLRENTHAPDYCGT